MSSQRRINASRANGAKSRGPVTPEGKAISARNGMRHGLFSETVVLECESSEHFRQLCEALYSDLKPTNSVEHALVETMALSRWRFLRAVALETASLNREYPKQDEEFAEPIRLANAYRDLCEPSGFLESLHRQETRLDRQFHRALNRLLALRASNPNPIPPAPEETENEKTNLIPQTNTPPRPTAAPPDPLAAPVSEPAAQAGRPAPTEPPLPAASKPDAATPSPTPSRAPVAAHSPAPFHLVRSGPLPR